ncbi:MAG: hypothetical protein CMH54_11805 [Myxococcales bacterium]|nr:hypothetical protein [Myxococcales bacterium]|tara:strand:+ start:2697 stop:3881 length:1185 start_codon:yes stop_codon:yes gene_type:complete
MLKPLVLTAGASFQETFLLHALDFKKTRSGGTYAELTLAHGSDQITGTLWVENQSELNLAEGQLVSIQGHVTREGDEFQIHIDMVEPILGSDLDPTDYLSSSNLDSETMFGALRHTISTIEDQDIRSLLTHFLDDPELSSRFRNAPASLTGHHNYSGGLMEHVLSVLHILDDMEKHYQRYYPGLVDRNYLLAGGFLHNIGRLFALHWSGPNTMQNDTQVIGHRIKSVVMLDKLAAQITGFPPAKLERLQHLVAAQKGATTNWGDASHTIEALLVHDVTRIDAYLGQFFGVCQKDVSSAWTQFELVFGGRLHNPLTTEHPGPSKFWTPQINLHDTVEIKAPHVESVFVSPVLPEDNPEPPPAKANSATRKRTRKSSRGAENELPAAIRDLFGPEH